MLSGTRAEFVEIMSENIQRIFRKYLAPPTPCLDPFSASPNLEQNSRLIAFTATHAGKAELGHKLFPVQDKN